MKNTFLLILTLIMSISLFAQDTEEVKEIAIQPDSLVVDSTAVVEEVKIMTAEEKLSQKAAEDIMIIYDNWDSSRNYDLIYPRIKGFVDDFYNEFADFNIELIERAKDGEILSDYENRSLVAYKGLKESVYDETSRFVSVKNFYWGYMDEELANSLKEIAKNLGDFTRSNQNELLEEQEKYVEELLNEKRKCEVQLDSIIAISGIEASLIDDKRNELIDIRTDWVEEKRITLFDLMSYESRRVNKIVSEYLLPLEENRNIEMFDIDDDIILAIKNSEGHEELIKSQIKYKFYSALVGKFGFYIQFDFKPILRTFRLNVLVGTLLFMVLFIVIFIRVKKNKDN
ncbi:MAG: hypothetical protein GQ534_01490, partial [Candidatus Delongbacteria bacterium]|nr:hypothetical protein [Candidatus Delongbacteria bacterium]